MHNGEVPQGRPGARATRVIHRKGHAAFWCPQVCSSESACRPPHAQSMDDGAPGSHVALARPKRPQPDQGLMTALCRDLRPPISCS